MPPGLLVEVCLFEVGQPDLCNVLQSRPCRRDSPGQNALDGAERVPNIADDPRGRLTRCREGNNPDFLVGNEVTDHGPEISKDMY